MIRTWDCITRGRARGVKGETWRTPRQDNADKGRWEKADERPRISCAWMVTNKRQRNNVRLRCTMWQPAVGIIKIGGRRGRDDGAMLHGPRCHHAAPRASQRRCLSSSSVSTVSGSHLKAVIGPGCGASRHGEPCRTPHSIRKLAVQAR